VRRGIVDKYKNHRSKPLLEHLADFRQSLLDKGDTEDHARLTHNRAKAIIKHCKFVFPSDIQPSKVMKYIAARKKDGLSIKSCNYYLGAIKHLHNLMVDDQRIAENPLRHLKNQNASKDVRRPRRALTLEEANKLLAATFHEPKHHNLTGKERYLLYIMAIYTGFRAKELFSMTWRLLDLG